MVDRDPASKTSAYTLFIQNHGPYQPIDVKLNKVNGRSFRIEWYKQFPWIEFSESLQAAFCFNCRVFPPNNVEDSFVNTGFKNWKKGVERCSLHQRSIAHKESTSKLSSYSFSKNNGTIITELNSAHKKTILLNREYIKCLLKTLLFCAKQGIAFRGHRETDSSMNCENFIELLKLRAQDNEIINNYFIEKEMTFTYTSPEYQNLFLKYMADNINKSIVNDIQTNGVYSILVDETQDLGYHEQVSIYIRYVDSFVPHEVFLGFYKTNTTDGLALTNVIKETLKLHGLNLSFIRGQCYDGAASMRGCYNGVLSKIKEENPLALYVHCYAHILNLCLVDLAKFIPMVRNTFGTLSTLHNFIKASSKRYAVFKNIQEESNKSGKKTLKSLSDTRWNCRIEAIRSVLENINTVFKTLSEIQNTDVHSGSDAASLLRCTQNFEFIFCLQVLNEVLGLTSALNLYLQSPKNNYSTVKSMAKHTIESLQSYRSDQKFSELWILSNNVCNQNEIDPPKLPRNSKIPKKLGGGGKQPVYENIQEYFKLSFYIPLLDLLINDITNRFSENDLDILQALCEVISKENPTNMVIQSVCSTYNLNESELKSELLVLNKMFNSNNIKDELEKRIDFFKENNLRGAFQNYYQCLKIFLSIPTNTASNERSFSSLKKLKTYLRLTMCQPRLSSIATLYIERNVKVNIDQVIDTFDEGALIRGRRLALK